MTLFTETFTFSKETSGVANTTQTITLTGAFQPKALWLWTSGVTSTATYADGWHSSYGFSDGTTHACQANAARDNVGGASNGASGQIRNDSICILLDATTTPSTILARAAVAFTSTGFTLTWNVSNTQATIIHGFAVGGTDITNVKVINRSTIISSGNCSYTDIGFQGDFVNFLMPAQSQAVNTAGSSIISIGAATSSTAEWTFGCNTRPSVATTNTYTYKEMNACLAQWSTTVAAVVGLADFTQFTSTGFDVNASDSFASNAMAYIVIKGGLWNVGSGTAPATATTQTVNTTSGRDAEGIMLFTWGDTTTSSAGTGESPNRISIGCATATTTRNCMSTNDTNGVTTTVSSRIALTDKIIRAHTAAATASSSTIVAEADISNMSNDGNFVLNWTTTLSGMGYVWFAVSKTFSAGGTNYTRTASDTITISEASLTRALSAARVPSADTVAVSESILTSKAKSGVPATETITISEAALTRQLSATRTASDTTNISESIAKLKSNIRLASDRIVVGEGVTPLYVHIPLYIYPTHWIAGSEWYQIRDLIAAAPDVQFVLKINVNSGPDTAVNSDYTTAIGIVKSLGNDKHTKIIGYVFTSYGARDINDVKTDIDRWVSFYGSDINGIFLDEMESITGDEAYYRDITNYIHKDKGLEISWGNPGTAIDESYVKANAVDVFQIAENTDYPSTSTIDTRTFSNAYNPTRFALGIHSVSSYNSTNIATYITDAAYIFVTGDVMPTPYDTVSAYIDDLAAQSTALPKVTRQLSVLRTPSDTTTLSESIARTKTPITPQATKSLYPWFATSSGSAIPSVSNHLVLRSTTTTASTAQMQPTDGSPTAMGFYSSEGSDTASYIDLLTWPGGTYTWRLNVTSLSDAANRVEVNSIILYRLNSAKTSIKASITININQNISAVQQYSGGVDWNDGTQNPGTAAQADVFAYKLILAKTDVGGITPTVQFSLGDAPSEFTVPLTVQNQNYTRTAGPDTISASESIVAMRSLPRVPSADTIAISDSRVRMLSATRVPSADTSAVSDSIVRSKSHTEIPSTDTTAISESIVKLTSRPRTVSDTTTIGETSLTRMLSATRVPTADTTTVGDTSLTRIRSLTRVPSTDTTSVSEPSLTRLLSLTRVPSSDTVVLSESLARSRSRTVVPATDTVIVTEPSLVRLLSLVRAPSTDTTSISESIVKLTSRPRTVSDTVVSSESILRMLSALRVPSVEVISVSDSISVQTSAGAQNYVRSVSDTVTLSESIARLLSAIRIGSDTTAVSDSITRLLSIVRTRSDTVTASDSTVSSITRVRTGSDTVVVTESLSRMLSAIRVGSDTTIVSDSIVRLLSLIRTRSETTTIGESLGVSLTGRISRTVTDTVPVNESVSRLAQLARSLSDTQNVNESVARSKTVPRAISDTLTISEASLFRSLSLSRSVASDTTSVIEAALVRLLSARRSLIDTIPISELNELIEHTRSLIDTISITEPTLKRVVTAVREVTDSVAISEAVFYQTWHRFVFDSVPVSEQLFRERQQLTGSVTYATPDEVRPLLGNIGNQRTDDQINLAIDAAYDEINTKTNRIPPDDWKDTDHNFGIIKKLTRYIAAKEMALGIKDYDTKPLDMEIESMYKDLLEYDTTASATQDIVGASQDYTYALNEGGIIWSTRVKNLKKGSSGENDTTINPNT